MDTLLPLLVALPLATATLLAIAATRIPAALGDALAVTTAAAVTAIAAVVLVRSADGVRLHWFGGWQPRDGVALGIDFVADPAGAGLALLAGVLTTAALLFSWRYFEGTAVLLPVLMLTFLAAMEGFALTG